MLTPRQHHYRVRQGDTLWSIAQQQYGDPKVWPEIAKANKLPNGNLILIGMTLQLPAIQNHPNSGGPKPDLSPTTLPSPHAPPLLRVSYNSPSPMNVPVARAVLFPAVKYDLDKLRPMTVSTPQADYKLQLKGEMTVQMKGAIPDIEISTNGNLSGKLKSEYDSRVIRLAGEMKVNFDPASKKVEMSCGFTVAAKLHGQELSSQTYELVPPNKFKYSVQPREIKGETSEMIFKGTLGYELEVTIRDSKSPPQTSPAVIPGRVVAWVTIGGLVTLGAVIIVGDLVKDVATGGAGAVETPLSWAAAMRLFSQAAAMAY